MANKWQWLLIICVIKCHHVWEELNLDYVHTVKVSSEIIYLKNYSFYNAWKGYSTMSTAISRYFLWSGKEIIFINPTCRWEHSKCTKGVSLQGKRVEGTIVGIPTHLTFTKCCQIHYTYQPLGMYPLEVRGIIPDSILNGADNNPAGDWVNSRPIKEGS